MPGTIEFFPEEGKYHCDGHRACSLCLRTVAKPKHADGRCPVCGKKMTIGVQHRVEQLADRPEGFYPARQRSPFESLVPLPEVIAASTGAFRRRDSRSPRGYRTRFCRSLGRSFLFCGEAPLGGHRAGCGRTLSWKKASAGCARGQVVPARRASMGEYGTVQLLSPR